MYLNQIALNTDAIPGEQGCPAASGVHSSCLEVKNKHPLAADGYYEVDINCNGVMERVFCDMTTDGGGWTKVYSSEYPQIWQDQERG